MAITSLDFLSSGAAWPPADKETRDRLKMIRQNKMIFEGDHSEVFREQFDAIGQVIGNFDEIISFPVIINFPKLISVKTADLLFGEKPKVSCGKKGSNQQKTIEQIDENSDLHVTSYAIAIDASRFGFGGYNILNNGDGKGGKISSFQPETYFPVVNPGNLREDIARVIAWKERRGNDYYLIAHIHTPGKIEIREIRMNKDGDKLMGTVSTNTITTGLTDFAIIPVHNLLTTDRTTGIDDYTDILSILAEIEVRLTSVSKVLNKHADPSLQGPASALEKDPKTGLYRLKLGEYFVRDREQDPKVEYLTWDAGMESNFKQIDKLINTLYTISEMGSAIFGDLTNGTGNIASGSALRRLMISALAKVNRIRMSFDSAMKKAIKLCSQISGPEITNLTKESITIMWKDGLPADPKEDAEIMDIRTGSKPTISQRRAIKALDDMEDDEVENELTEIQNDEANANPIKSVTPFAGENDPDDNPDDIETVIENMTDPKVIEAMMAKMSERMKLIGGGI